MTDWLSAGPAIVERLRERAPSFADVRTAVSIEAAVEQTPRTPAAWVIWRGDAIVDSPAIAPQFEQQWLVLVGVRDLRDQATGAGVVETAGPLIGEVLEALTGFAPVVPGGRLKRIATQEMPGAMSGTGFFPLAFSGRRTLALECPE